MLTAIVGAAVIVLALSLVIAVARDPGPPPADVAAGYEEAWDRLDFEALWDLSGEELRDGLARRDFAAAKRDAYARQADLGNLARSIAVERVDVHDALAEVRTRVDLHGGGSAHNVVTLSRRAGRWVVIGYQLRSDAPSP